MSLESIFSVCNFLVLPGWMLLIFIPQWKWTQRATAFLTPVLLGMVYIALFATNRGQGGGFGSLAQVAMLFQSPAVLLAGWVHYLAFDLFVGGWEARDALRLGISRWLVAPCLLLTFMLGPAGLFSYLLLRYVLRRRIDPE